jgi:hypothetical protein
MPNLIPPGSECSATLAFGMVQLAAEEAEGGAREWLAATERAVLAMKSTVWFL